MKRTLLSALLLGGLAGLPALLTVAFTYLETAHPAEDRFVENTAFLEDSPNQFEIVLFGYVGCEEVCPVSLAKLKQLLELPELEHMPRSVGTTFVEISGKTDRNSILAEKYASGFSDQIRSYVPGIDTYREITREFMVKVYDNRGSSGRISHTDHFFLLSKSQGRWKIRRVIDNRTGVQQLTEIISGTTATAV